MLEEAVDRLFTAHGFGPDQLDEDLGSESSLVSDWQRVATWHLATPQATLQVACQSGLVFLAQILGL